MLAMNGSRMRKSSVFLSFSALGMVSVMFAILDGHLTCSSAAPLLEERARMVETLGLTDIALFTEARYTRHPSQADRHSAFQDHPGSMEHFPTGSFLPPPKRLYLR